MSRICHALVIILLIAACGSPPSRPESLWDSLPVPEEGTAKSVPAKVWPVGEGGSSSGPIGTGPSPELLPPEPKPEVVGAVVLNEIYYDAVGSDTDGVLFIELFGEPGLPIGGCRVQFVDGGDGSLEDAVTLSEGALIPEDGYYVIADSLTGFPDATSVLGADLVDNFDPQNGPDAVQLIDNAGILVDAIGYGEGIVAIAENGLAAFEGMSALDVVNGHSLERKEPGLDTGNNLEDFIEREVPTPGSGPPSLTE